MPTDERSTPVWARCPLNAWRASRARSSSRASTAVLERPGAGRGEPSGGIPSDPDATPTSSWMAPPAQEALPAAETPERPHVVAEILSDGSIRVLDEVLDDDADSDWGTGHLTGRGWTLWWERRRW